MSRVKSIIPSDREITLMGQSVTVETLDLLESRALISKLFRETEALYDINTQVNSGFRGILLRLCGIDLPMSKPTYHILDFDINENAQQMVAHIEKSVFLWRRKKDAADHSPEINYVIDTVARSKLEAPIKQSISRRLKMSINLLNNCKNVVSISLKRSPDLTHE